MSLFECIIVSLAPDMFCQGGGLPSAILVPLPHSRNKNGEMREGFLGGGDKVVKCNKGHYVLLISARTAANANCGL